MVNRILNGLISRIKFLTNFIFHNLSLYFFSKIIIKGIPLCQQKIYCQGDGEINIGKSCSFGEKLGGRFKNGYIELQTRTSKASIIINDDVHINNNLFISCKNKIEIGARTLIGERVTIYDYEAHGILPNLRRNNNGNTGKVKIGENCWIGNNVIILKNSNIGDNTIVAAGAVVSGNFPENVIIGGIPATVKKKLNR
jgi:acetyltransferase-like isoleucine patch superfamily enzyme